jgi:two-component system sensor histidine kinase DesK
MGHRDPPSAEPDERPFQWGWIFGAVWLVYLSEPLDAALRHRPGTARDIGVAAVFAFAATYLVVLVHGRHNRLAGRRPAAPLAWFEVSVLALLTIAMVPGAHEHALAGLVFVAATAMFLLPTRAAWFVVAMLALGGELAVEIVPGWSENGSALGVVLAAVAVFAIRLAFERNRRLVQAQDEMAQLAVSAERTRFARDLHDILGHSLTVITVKAELAGRLLRDDPQRAAAEIADVERLSRDALADVRRAVAGYREVSLATELATARESLSAAGIEADLPAAVDDVPGELRELYGWVVREGVTNVIRHSGARRCVVRAGAGGIEVVDDGVGVGHEPGSTTGGHGLAGLRERAAAVGARLFVGPGEPTGFRLALVVTDRSAPERDEVDAAAAGHR